mgnify:FL=1
MIRWALNLVPLLSLGVVVKLYLTRQLVWPQEGYWAVLFLCLAGWWVWNQHTQWGVRRR